MQPNSLQSVDLSELTFPVRAVFSSKLRPNRFEGKIEFKDVHFSFPTDLRTPALQGMSFVVEPGQKVALVGSSGCGKSTCMQLLQRLYDPISGTIEIDGRDIKEYDIHYLRSRVVIVDQHTVLFNKTIKENITFGLDCAVSDEDVIQALKDAQIWDFVNSKPDKLLHMIAENGKNLSGGQRQRLAIARAIIRKPNVILLDEATSALDNASEAKVQKALDALARHGSAIVIAHRLGTIKDSHKICVVDKGQVIEEGTHAELLGKQTPRHKPKSDPEEDIMDDGPESEPGQTPKEEKDNGPASYKKLWELSTGEKRKKKKAKEESWRAYEFRSYGSQIGLPAFGVPVRPSLRRAESNPY